MATPMITLSGIISDEKFHRCVACIKELQSQGKVMADVQTFFPAQWDFYLKDMQNRFKGEFYQHKGSPLVLLNGVQYIGDMNKFLEWALQNFRYTDKTSALIYKKVASDAHRNAINNTPGRSYVQLSLNHGAAVPSKVTIELFEDICPKTCENFRQLC